MSRQEQVAEQTRIRHALLKNGYVPLANKDKMCVLPGWNAMHVDTDKIDEWADSRRWLATGVRVEGQMVALDFDIDSADMLDAIWDKLPDDLYDILEEAPRRYGKGEKMCLFARLPGTDAGFGCIRSGAYKRRDDESPEPVLHRLEVFGSASTRQIGVFGAHTVDKIDYRWDGKSLLDVPVSDLPVITSGQIIDLCTLVTEVMDADANWEHEARARAGRVAETSVFDLTDDMTFDVLDGDSLTLDELEAKARYDGGLRCSASWLEGDRARNRTRCLVSINPADGRVQIYETAGGELHRPKSMDTHGTVAAIYEHLKARGIVSEAKGPRGEVMPGEAVDKAAYVEAFGGTVDMAYGERKAVHIEEGGLALAVRAVAQHLQTLDWVFEFNRSLCFANGEATSAQMSDPARVQHELGLIFNFTEETARGKIKGVDPSMSMVNQLIAMDPKARGLRKLTGIVDMPVLNSKGIVLDGFDEETGLLVRCGGRYAGWESEITDEDAAEAVDALWAPFAQFPFVSSHDRGAYLAALLTAVARRWLPTAPAFAIDAPAQGSGKSLLANCLIELAGGGKLMAPLPYRNEEESAKTLLSVLAEAEPVAVFDNQIGLVDSASFAAALTSPTYSGRLLGTTSTIPAQTNILFVFTGNNMTFGGDMPRRVVLSRIDAKTDTPFARSFTFNPLTVVRENREVLVMAALRIMAWARVKLGTSEGKLGSFETWDGTISEAIRALSDPRFIHPSCQIEILHNSDERRDELHELLGALEDIFKNDWFTSRDLMGKIARHGEGGSAGALRGVIEESVRNINARSVGMYMKHRKDQRVQGRHLVIGADAKHGNKYRVARDGEALGGEIKDFADSEAKRVAHLMTVAGGNKSAQD